MKKKANKKKAVKIVAPDQCANCFYRRDSYGGMIQCNRYPQTTRALDNHWCGEYRTK